MSARLKITMSKPWWFTYRVKVVANLPATYAGAGGGIDHCIDYLVKSVTGRVLISGSKHTKNKNQPVLYFKADFFQFKPPRIRVEQLISYSLRDGKQRELPDHVLTLDKIGTARK